MGDHLGLSLAGVEQRDQEFVATHSNHRFFRPHVAHQESAHLEQNGVTRSMSMCVVVLLEMIDVDVDASPFSVGGAIVSVERGEMSPVVTPGEWISHALFKELCLELLPRGDVDEDSMKDHFPGVGIGDAVPRIENRSYSTVGPCYLELAIAERSRALEKSYFLATDFRVYEVAHPIIPEVGSARHTKNPQERWICVEDLAFLIGDVDPLAKILGEFGKCFRIAQAAEPRMRRSGRLVTQLNELPSAACALPMIPLARTEALMYDAPGY